MSANRSRLAPVPWFAARLPEGLIRVGRALAHRNFRLFFFGQAVSMIGTWVQQVALLWLVYRLTGSSTLLGITGFFEQIPTFLLAPIAGVLTDRWNRRRVLILTQSLMMIQAVLLALLVLSGTAQIWHLLVLSSFLGTVSAFDITGRQAFLSEMVPRKEDLANAIALNSSIVNAARLVGPALAGLIIAATGEGVCFLLNALSYLAVLASLLRMEVTGRAVHASTTRFWEGFRAGFWYTFGNRAIRRLLFLMAAVSFLGMPYSVLMPIVVTEYFGGSAELLGYLMSASGTGALASAVYLAGRPTLKGLGVVVAVAPIAFGTALITVALSRTLWLTLPALVIMGFALMLQMASSNTLLQAISPEDRRGRVMSFSIMSFMGMIPLGSLALGSLAGRVGITMALLAGGIGCLLAAVLFLLQLASFRAEMRLLYYQNQEAGPASTSGPLPTAH